MVKKVWKEDTHRIMTEIRALLNQVNDFSSGSIETLVKQHIEQKGLGFGRVMSPLRLLLVGSGMGPHLFDIMEMIGREETIGRIEKGLKDIG